MKFVDGSGAEITSVPAGQPVKLEYSFDNPNGGLVSVEFSHVFPARMSVAASPNISATCYSTRLTGGVAMSTSVQVESTISGNSSCKIVVDVVISTPGSLSTSTTALETEIGPSGPASATIEVSSPPSFSMYYNPTSTTNNDSATLTYFINNVLNGVEATGLNFNHAFQTGINSVEIADPANASTTCTGGTLTAVAGGTSVTYTGGSVGAGASCRVDVHVKSDEAGTFAERTGELTSSLGNSGTASGTLTVSDVILPKLLNVFSNDRSPTSNDLVSFDFEFSEPMSEASINADDFIISGTTATASVSQVINAARFRVVLSGGNLANLSGTVSVSLRSGATVNDLAGNALVNINATNTNQNSVEVVNDSTQPTLVAFERLNPLEQKTSDDTLVFKISFSEPVRNVTADSFRISGTSATGALVSTSKGDKDGAIGASAPFSLASFPTDGPMMERSKDFAGQEFTLTVSGGDLADLNGEVSLDLAAPIVPTEFGTFSMDGPPSKARFGITDFSGNSLVQAEPATDESYSVYNGDLVLSSITRRAPETETTDADELEWDFQFNALSSDFALTADNFTLTGTTATLSVARYSIGFYVKASGGDLAALNGNVTIALKPGITDGFGNTLEGPTGANENSYKVINDATGPVITIASTSTGPVSGSFPVTFTFSEDVTGFAEEDLTVVNASVANFKAVDARSFSADLTPVNDGAVTVDIAADVATDAASNGNMVASQFSILADGTPPVLTINLPGTETTKAFDAVFKFNEDVTGFELVDITVANGVASEFTATSASEYKALITPQAPGTVTISVAAAAANDTAGNASGAQSVAIEAVSNTPEISVVLSSETADPGAVVAAATISNPGSEPLPFTASVDVPWIDITPTTGTISPLGTFDISVSLNDGVNELQAGDYRGTVTVVVGSAPVASAGLSGGADGKPVQSGGSGGNPFAVGLSAGTILVELPVNVAIQQRFGNVQLVTTTPSGVSGEASFTYTSDVPAFNNLTLSTRGNTANASSGSILFGSYAITQSAPPGWRVKSFNCSGDLDGATRFDAATATATIDVDPSENIVCVYENVRDEDAVRLATQRAIRNFMVRRADRIVDAAPDLSRRFTERLSNQRGGVSANVSGRGYYNMNFSASLAGMRNQAAAEDASSRARYNNTETPFMDGWDIWLAAEISGISDDRAGERASTDFAMGQLGVDYLLNDDLIIGAMAQYDWMDDQAREVFVTAGAVRGAQVQGEGWMAGPYAVWNIKDTLVLDVSATYGESDNRVNPLGLYSDDFDTERFMLRANLTGEFRSGPWSLRPQAGITHFEESQDGYTDSLGIAIPGQDITLGRLRAGPQLAWRGETDGGGWLEVSGAVRAVWDYDTADLLTESGGLTSGGRDMRADAEIGFAAQTKWGPLIRFEFGMSGLGVSDYEAQTARLEIRVPFGAAGTVSGMRPLAGPGMGIASGCGIPGGGLHSAFASQRGCGSSMLQ